MKEQWRPVVGFEGLYEVSSLGKVISLNYHRTGRGKVLKLINSKGYLHVSLHKNGKSKIYKVHRLVATAFIPNPDNLPQVNHINEIKVDNRVENLEWCDCRYNINHGTHNQRVAEFLTNRPDCSKQVMQYTLNGELVATYPSVSEASRQTGFHISNISACCLGKIKTVGGFIWQYV